MNAPATRLLLVDDDMPQLHALCQTLREEGYDVSCCETAEAALQALRHQNFDVLLCDLRMPGMDGLALMEQAQVLAPDMVPVMITGQGSIQSAVQAMRKGALDYVLKPLRMSQLRPVLMRAAQHGALLRENCALQQRVAQRTAQLEAANKELDAFAARVAHDLREPVGVVRGFARLLEERRGEQFDAEARSYLRYIIEAADRADRMTRDLLNFSRMLEGPLAQQEVDLNVLARRAREIVELGDEQRRTTWDIGALPVVRGDESLLQQVLVNLMSNAHKYSRQQAAPHVRLEHRMDNGMHVISVRDNGVGFNPAQSARLFTPFQRLHRADHFEGNGMGLANVKRIVERHGGSVRGESQPGQGATFTVSLPAAELAEGGDGGGGGHACC